MTQNKVFVAVTGGIGSGKSTVMDEISKQGHATFSADEEGHHIGLQGRDLTVRARKGRPQSLDEAAALEQDAPVRKDVGAGDLGAGGSGAPEISFDPLEILFSWLKFQNIAGIAHSFTAPFLTVPLSVLAL